MKQIDHLFRKRIGYPEQKKITFEDLSDVLIKTARSMPFENLCIMRGEYSPITKESLIAKTLVRNEGGLCYELNPVLYLFMKENGFIVSLVSGVVYNQTESTWSSTGRTHATILLENDGEEYLVDTGFGGNLPLIPVPLSGEIVKSVNGEFRVSKTVNELGNYLLEMKRKDKDVDWQIGYVFDTSEKIEELSELQEMQRIIVESKDSSFNKSPLITMLTEEGSMTLTNKALTKWHAGEMTKEDISDEKFQELAKQYFGLD